MKRKRNVIKRNSGFVIGCVLTAGVSFATANFVMEKGVASLVIPPEAPESEKMKETAPPEKRESKIYETDAFTVTASGNIIKGVEKETPEKTETEERAETDRKNENGNVITGNAMGSTTGDTTERTTDGNSETTGGPGVSEDGSSGRSDGNITVSGGTPGGNSSGNSSSGSSSSGGDYMGPSIVITDPGNGDYYYSDGSGWGSSSGSNWGSSSGSNWGSSSGSNWGGSSGGSSGGSTGENPGGSDNNIIVDNHPTTTPNDVILWGISSRYIDESELYNYSADELCLIRNEIFALHGRMFRMPELQEYFNGKSWYVPRYDPDEFDANMFDYLNDYEKANLQVILNYEDALAGNQEVQT